jgi:hypothetical protein
VAWDRVELRVLVNTDAGNYCPVERLSASQEGLWSGLVS